MAAAGRLLAVFWAIWIGRCGYGSGPEVYIYIYILPPFSFDISSLLFLFLQVGKYKELGAGSLFLPPPFFIWSSSRFPIGQIYIFLGQHHRPILRFFPVYAQSILKNIYISIEISIKAGSSFRFIGTGYHLEGKDVRNGRKLSYIFGRHRVVLCIYI